MTSYARTRVLDPACGTGNFLYVSLELMKRLEGEVVEALIDLGGQEALRGLAGQAHVLPYSAQWLPKHLAPSCPSTRARTALASGGVIMASPFQQFGYWV
jgi:hypothetical protein